MTPDPSFIELMARLRAGDGEAAAQVFHRFARRLIALARSRLDGRMRQKVDPEDVVQSVYKSFFLRHAQGQMELENWDSLWGVLTVITVRKCGRWIERFHAPGSRNVNVEVSTAPSASEARAGWEALASDPTPSEALQLAETVEQLLRGFEERERAIISLSLQGYPAAEIRERVGLSRSTVERVLQRVKKRVERMRARDAEES